MNERIKKLRRELDLTQKDFGARIGVKGNTIAQYEIGRNAPVDSVLSLICREFDVNEEWLRYGTGEMFKASPTDALDALAAEHNLSHGSYVAIEKFLKLRPEIREGLVSYFMEVAAAISDVAPETPAVPDVAAAEAAYEKSLGLAPSGASTASNTIEGTESEVDENVG